MPAYQGGKQHLSKRLAAIINRYTADHKCAGVIVPFVGMGGVTIDLDPDHAPVYASDLNADIVALWWALQQNPDWHPPDPDQITRAEYERWKAYRGKPSATRAFYGVFCSFGGVYFHSFTPTWIKTGVSQPIAEASLHHLERFRHTLQTKARDVKILPAASYTRYLGLRGYVFYADPPYPGTTGYKVDGRKTQKFDHVKFWDDMYALSQHNKVFVSYNTAPLTHPEHWRPVFTHGRTVSYKGNKRTRSEFMYESQ